MVGRVIAWILLVLALVVAGRDAVLWIETGRYAPASLAALWAIVDPTSWDSVTASVEQDIPSWSEAILAPLRDWPVSALLAGAGLLIALLFGHRPKRKWRSGALN